MCPSNGAVVVLSHTFQLAAGCKATRYLTCRGITVSPREIFNDQQAWSGPAIQYPHSSPRVHAAVLIGGQPKGLRHCLNFHSSALIHLKSGLPHGPPTPWLKLITESFLRLRANHHRRSGRHGRLVLSDNDTSLRSTSSTPAPNITNQDQHTNPLTHTN